MGADGCVLLSAFVDVPSFVTGDSLVVFDPHTRYIPGATLNQPGIRIKFASPDGTASAHSLPSQFPDQV
jgi:sacsin